ncbi:MAG: DUF2905 domain-containing protein [Gammaproteobacteria bacterium]
MGKIMILIGLVLVALGAIWTWAPGLLGWFGKLPGDLRFQRGGGTVFIPLGSMLLISLVLNLIYYLFLRR